MNLGCKTYRENANTLQSPDILVQILYVCMDLMSGGNSTVEQILRCFFLEVCAVGDVHGTIVSVQGLIDVWVGQVVVFKLSQSVTVSRESH